MIFDIFCCVQDDFYNAKAKKGTIFHRIKNMPPKKNPENRITNEAELVDFLKQCVVAKDKQKLKSKLEETITLRKKLLRQNNEDFADFMAFYFADPELVCVCFYSFISSHHFSYRFLICFVFMWCTDIV